MINQIEKEILVINQIEKEILIFIFEILVISSLTTNSAKFNEFNAGNVIQIKVSDESIKRTTLERCFMKVTARPSFTRLIAIRRINRVH